MKIKLLFVLCCFIAVNASAQMMKSGATGMSVTQAYKMHKANNAPLLSQEAALAFIKSSTKGAKPPAAKPAGTPHPWNWVMPQMKDNDGDIYFQNPETVFPWEARLTADKNSGSAMYFNVNCNAPGYYVVQINCSFWYDGNAGIDVMRLDPNQPETTVTLNNMKQNQATVFTFGVNLVQGQNTIRIACKDNSWDFTACHINPLK